MHTHGQDSKTDVILYSASFYVLAQRTAMFYCLSRLSFAQVTFLSGRRSKTDVLAGCARCMISPRLQSPRGSFAEVPRAASAAGLELL